MAKQQRRQASCACCMATCGVQGCDLNAAGSAVERLGVVQSVDAIHRSSNSRSRSRNRISSSPYSLGVTAQTVNDEGCSCTLQLHSGLTCPASGISCGEQLGDVVYVVLCSHVPGVDGQVSSSKQQCILASEAGHAIKGAAISLPSCCYVMCAVSNLLNPIDCFKLVR